MRKTLLLLLLLTFARSESIMAQPGEAAAKDSGEHHYAVTLLSSFEPIPDALMPAGFKEHRVYRTQSEVFGKTLYFVRLGFFATPAQATAMRDQLHASYPGAFMTEVTADEFSIASPRRARAETPAAAPVAPPAPAREEFYVVTLASSRTLAPAPVAVLPGELKGKRLYLRDTLQNGITLHSLQLGFFATAAEAQAAVRLLVSTYPEATVRPASAREQDESPRTLVAMPSVSIAVVPPPEKATLPVMAVTGTAESQASDLLEQSRAALTRGDNAAAIQLLNRLLRLPPNAHSQDAQELIGLAHERQKEIAVAKQEYRLYLRLYPEGPGADRVLQRLAALDAPPTPAPLKKERRETSAASIYGSLSQYYYYGQSQTDSSTTVLGPATDSIFSGTDQSALYSNLDLHARYTSGSWDNRVVIRDTYTASFLDNTESSSRLYSAYYEAANKVDEYSGRFGRQPGTSGGVVGRFDGASVGYNVLPKWRVNVAAGTPVEFYPVSYIKQFWGTSLDFGLFLDHWNGNVYYIQQTADGIPDRQAIGTELRYFDPKGSALLYIDYDTLFGELNIATFQSTWLSSPTTTWNMQLDHRLAPTLMTSNALFNTSSLAFPGLPIPPPTAAQAASLSYWLQFNSEEQLRQAAIANSPTFDTYMLGVSHNLNATWQVGGDVRRFNLSAPPSSPTISTVLGTGATTMYTLQTIANGFFRKRDLSVLSLSYLEGATYQGESLAITHRMLFQESWTLDLALSYYLQQGVPLQSIVGTDTHSILTDNTRISPMVRLGYRWGKNLSLEAEFGLEKGTSHVEDTNITAGPPSVVTNQDTSRQYFTLGYRWNF